MATQEKLTITRADLIEITAEALASSEGITDEQKLGMCETAHKTKSILIGDWLVKDCGCLVGATYRKRLDPCNPKSRGGDRVEEVLGNQMRKLGNRFDERLRDKIDYFGSTAPVAVID